MNFGFLIFSLLHTCLSVQTDSIILNVSVQLQIKHFSLYKSSHNSSNASLYAFAQKLSTFSHIFFQKHDLTLKN